MKKFLFILTFIIVISFSAIACAAEVASWAKNDFDALKVCGIITSELEEKTQSDPIKRAEFAHLIYNAYLQENPRVSTRETPFLDADAEYLSALYELKVISGDDQNNFNGEKFITRQEACVILSNFYNVYEKKGLLPVETSLSKYKDVSGISPWAVPYASKLSFVNFINGADGYFMPSSVVTIEQAYCFINRIAKLGKKAITLTKTIDGDKVTLNWSGVDADEYQVHVIITRNTRHFDETGSDIKTYTTTEKSFTLGTDPVRVYEVTVSANSKISNKQVITTESADYQSHKTEIYDANKALIKEYYENLDAENRLKAEKNGEEYSGIEIPEDKTMPTTKEEADYLQTDIEVPVWRIGQNGKKYSSTMTITIHKHIADNLYNAFKEVYEGEEQFPIDYTCFYAWRGDGGEHNIGTAIDINPTQNYCLYSNGTIVGDYWKPYDDPYSITPFGEVIKAFERNGFNWGGDTWTRNRDYMHFSYLGT